MFIDGLKRVMDQGPKRDKEFRRALREYIEGERDNESISEGGKMGSNKIQFNFRIDKDLFKRMDKAVDGMRYRSRGHFIEIAVIELLERLKTPKRARK